MPANDRHTRLLLERIERLCDLIETNAPEPICAAGAATIVDSFTLLWPELWTRIGENMQMRLRNSAGVCCECGETEIPALLTHLIDCRNCDEAHRADMRENYKIDPYAPEPPDIEEILVDLTNSESAKVNNLPDDFTDGLERMLESRERREPGDE